MIRTVYIVNHTHTDIGYTNRAPIIAAEQARHLNDALALCEKYQDAPEGERFIWTVESFWTVWQYARFYELKRLVRLARKGLVALTGFTHQPLTQLCTLEELMAEMEPARQFADTHHLPMETAMLNDIGGVSGNLAQVMNRAGMKNLILGAGAWRVMTPIADLPHLFYYRSPDGSRIRMYHLGLGRGIKPSSVTSLPAQYGFGVTYLLWPYGRAVTDGEKAVVEGSGDRPLLDLIRRLEAEGYPHDAMLLQLGMDNRGPQEDIVPLVRHWNATHDAVRLRLSGPDAFFAHVESASGGGLPELQGELTCSWSEHVLTQGFGQGALQRARTLATTNDALGILSLEAGVSYNGFPAHRKRNLENRLLFCDHTFGLTMWGWQNKAREANRLHGAGSVYDFSQRAWDQKQGYATTAESEALQMAESQETALTVTQGDPHCLTALNPLPYPWAGMASVCIRNAEWAGKDIAITEGSETIGADREDLNACFSRYTFPVRLEAGEMKSYPIVPAPPGASAFECTEDAEALSIRTAEVALRILKRTGEVVSLCFRGVEYADGTINEIRFSAVNSVRPDSQYMGLCDGATFHPIPAAEASVSVVQNGARILRVEVRRDVPGARARVLTEITVPAQGARVHFRNRIRQIHEEEPIALHAVFPLALRDARLSAMQQGYWLSFPSGVSRGGAVTNIGFQNGIHLSDGRKAVLLTSHQAMILSRGGPKYYSEDFSCPPDEKAHVYLYCANNLWNTNCALRQAGDLSYDVTVEEVPPDLDPGDCSARVHANRVPPSVFAGVRYDRPGMISVDSPAMEVTLSRLDTNGARIQVGNTAGTPRTGWLRVRAVVADHAPDADGWTRIPLSLAAGQFTGLDLTWLQPEGAEKRQPSRPRI